MAKGRGDVQFTEIIFNVDVIIKVEKIEPKPDMTRISIKNGIACSYTVDKSFEEMKKILCV